MILKREDILEMIESGSLEIDPFDGNSLENFVYNIKVGDRVFVFDKRLVEVVDLDKDFSRYVEEYRINNHHFILHPNETVFVETLERIKLPENVFALLHPKAKLPMIGIVIHTGGGKIDPGYNGKLILGITNFGGVPIRIKKGMNIAQVSFWKL